MSWISDVKHDLSKLDVSLPSLKKFAITVGIVFILISIWFFYKGIYNTTAFIFSGAGLLLLVFRLINPALLRKPYLVWMGSAFVIGWLISRIILTLLFFCVLFPVGVAAKIFGKKFVDAQLSRESKSYWIRREGQKINYEKMF